MNIGFAGSDDFSLKILSGLTEMIADGSSNLSMVLTMPARNRGRGQILTENPISLFSRKNNLFIETIEPDRPVVDSLEDRIVKNFFKDLFRPLETDPEKALYSVHGEPLAEFVGKNVIEASLEELDINPRARSAKLRIIQKL